MWRGKSEPTVPPKIKLTGGYQSNDDLDSPVPMTPTSPLTPSLEMTAPLPTTMGGETDHPQASEDTHTENSEASVKDCGATLLSEGDEDFSQVAEWLAQHRIFLSLKCRA